MRAQTIACEVLLLSLLECGPHSLPTLQSLHQALSIGYIFQGYTVSLPPNTVFIYFLIYPYIKKNLEEIKTVESTSMLLKTAGITFVCLQSQQCAYLCIWKNVLYFTVA